MKQAESHLQHLFFYLFSLVFRGSNINGAGASFDLGSSFSSSSIGIIVFDEVDSDLVSLEDVGVE